MASRTRKPPRSSCFLCGFHEEMIVILPSGWTKQVNLGTAPKNTERNQKLVAI